MRDATGGSGQIQAAGAIDDPLERDRAMHQCPQLREWRKQD